jgi:SNF2 family DNA or RNA helicase
MLIDFDHNKIIVTYDYDLIINELIKPLGAVWDKFSESWEMSLNHYQELTQLLPHFSVSLAAQAAGREFLKAKQIKVQTASCRYQQLIKLADLDAVLANGRSLYQHQKEAVQFAIAAIESSIYRGVILALDMGLGKTLTSLVTARAYQLLSDCQILVICPATLKKNWLIEAEQVNAEIGSYSWAKIPEIPKKDFILIADECHYAQSGRASQRGAKFLDLAESPYCLGTIMLSGTPMKNGRPVNLYPLLVAANHPLSFDQLAYETRYCNGRPTAFTKWDTSGASNLKELAAGMQDVLLRRTKKQCLDLPLLTRILKPCEITGQRLRDWKELIRKAQIEFKVMEEKSSGAALVLMMRLKQAASLAKVATSIEMAEELLEQDQPVVIFTEFLKTAEILTTAFKKSGVSLETLTGSVPVKDRQRLVENFQSGQSKVFISTFGAGGTGITLTAASHVILIDRPWTPGDAEQSEARCHRIGTVNAVTSYWLQFSEIDTTIDTILARKQERIDLVMAGQRQTMRGTKGISPADLALGLADELFGDPPI